MLVHYWAEWAAPCRMIAPMLEQIAAEHGDRLEVMKINTDHNPLTPGNAGVTSIPTLHVFKEGEVVMEIVGPKPKAALLRDLAQFIH